MFKQFIKLLNEPYPDREDFRSILLGSIFSGFLVFSILSLFLPFGLSTVGNNAYMYSFYFGIVTIVTAFCYELLLKYVLRLRRNNQSWTLWKWIVTVLVLLLLIAIANYSLIIFLFDHIQITLAGFGKMLSSTLIVGIFPICIFGSMNLINNLKRYQKLAIEVRASDFGSSEVSRVKLPIKNSQKVYELNVSKLLFVEAMQNYVMIHFLDSDLIPKKHLHRNTLSSVEIILSQKGIVRTHRSYLINPAMIEDITGNAQGLKLSLKHNPESIIPVSRKYIKVFNSIRKKQPKSE